MPRKPRLHYPGALYHIVSRGNNRQTVFQSPNDYKRFLTTLHKVKDKKPFHLYAYCLMPNHIHLLMEVGEVPTWIVLQRVLSSYTAYFNHRHRRHGHLFQGRYKAILCEKNNYLLELTRYIHLNPVRAKLVKGSEEWKWSGHAGYLSGNDPLLSQNTVLGIFGNEPGKARNNYAQFVREGLKMGKKENLYPPEKIPYLGEEAFVENQMMRHEELVKKVTPPKPPNGKALSTLLEEVANTVKMRGEMILGPSRMTDVAEARRRFICRALETGCTGVAVARFLGRSQAYVAKVMSEISE